MQWKKPPIMKKLFQYAIAISTFLFFGFSASAQEEYTIRGVVVDASSKEPLPGASVVIQHKRDTTYKPGTTTNVDGSFELNARKGGYRMTVSFVGYRNFSRDSIRLFADMRMDTIRLMPDNKLLNEFQVEEKAIRVEIKGDTTQYNAGAYKTNPDATAEDLVKKMPGITSENGTLKANGEDVKRVLVNGRPFFGDDPSAALKNMPANMVDKVQVYDEQSAQSSFTGFNDGSGTRTINIITNQKIGDGSFGKIYGAYGTDDLYNAGLSFNNFKGSRKFSVLGMSNNINQQNFSSEDLLGVNAANSSSSSGGGGGRGGMGGGRPGGGGPMGYGQQSNFVTGNQNGVASTHSFGLNYSNVWKKKIAFTGSYFGNLSDRNALTDLNRTFIYDSDTSLQYGQHDTTNNKTWNHRINIRLDMPLDSVSALSWYPKASFQQTTSSSITSGEYFTAENFVQSMMSNLNGTEMQGYTLGHTFTYRRRLSKKGRTISAEWTADYSDKSGDGYLNSRNEYFYSSDSLVIVDQQNTTASINHTEGINLTYTEPIREKGQLQITYSPNFTWSSSEKLTYDYNNSVSDYTDIDTALTSQFKTNYLAHKGGLLYRFNNQDKFNFQVGLNAQYATLTSNQSYPVAFDINKSFFNLLPTASAYYAFTKASNVRINYRTYTNAPSASQLQDVIDNTNTLLLKGGNPNLVQSYTHSVFGRWMKSNTEKGTSLFWMLYTSITDNYIGSSTLIASADTLLNGNVLLQEGAQYTEYVNLKGNHSMRTYLNLGFPMAPIKSNVNFTLGGNYAQTPALINGEKNLAANFGITPGITIASNFSEKIDFTISYSGGYTVVRNSLQTSSDNNYFVGTANAKINLLFGKGLVLTTDATHSMYRGLEKEYNQDFILWNAGLGYKFLKDRLLDVRIIAYDILNQNNSISRSVTETYIDDTRTNVLNQYFMLQVTYTFRNFIKKEEAKKN
jgi:hypothetical protein